MTHARETIRGTVITAITGLTTTGTRVHAALELLLDRPRLPAIAADIVSEEPSTWDGGAHVEERAATLRVRGFSVSSSSIVVSDVLDDIDEESATALYTAFDAGDLGIDGFEFVSMEKEFSTAGEDFRGQITIDYMLRYRLDAAAPTTVI